MSGKSHSRLKFHIFLKYPFLVLLLLYYALQVIAIDWDFLEVPLIDKSTFSYFYDALAKMQNKGETESS